MSQQFTVVIPLRDGRRFVLETLDSVAAQTLPPAEVIVVDDGSDDEGFELAAGHSVGARMVKQSRAGEAAARNWGLALASTEVVTFLDQDDLWHPEHLARAAEILAKRPDVSIAPAMLQFARACDAQFTTEASSVVVPDLGAYEWLCEHHPPTGLPQLDDVSWERALAGGISASVIATREMLIRAGGFPIACPGVGDYLLLANLTRLGPLVRVAPASIYYRAHAHMASWSYDMARRILAVRNMLREASGHQPTGASWDAYATAVVIERGTGGAVRSVLDALAYAELLRPPLSLTMRVVARAVARRLTRRSAPRVIA